MIRRYDYKHDELRRFAEIIITSDSKSLMIQRINGFRNGRKNKSSKDNRIDLWDALINSYI